MQRLDSHQHFWDLQRLSYPWLKPEQQPLYRNFYPADLAPALADCQVSGTVVVQATHAAAETQWLLSLARETPFVRGVVGWFDLKAPDLAAQLDAARAAGPLCGVRHQVHDEADPEWLLQPLVLRGLRVLAQQALPYDLLVRPVHLPVLPRVFAAVPDGRWVIDHVAKPEIASGRLLPWRDVLSRVAAHPQVYCKLSGLITEAKRDWSVDDLRPYVEAVLSLFGPARLMFGSDWPVCLLAGAYRQVCGLVDVLTQGLSAAEQASIWSGTARAVYRLP